MSGGVPAGLVEGNFDPTELMTVNHATGTLADIGPQVTVADDSGPLSPQLLEVYQRTWPVKMFPNVHPGSGIMGMSRIFRGFSY